MSKLKTQYPAIFTPSSVEPFNIEGHIVEIPKCIVRFTRWLGEPLKQTFGGKPQIAMDDKPVFAELAIKAHFEKEGWDVRWVETYGKTTPIYLSEWIDDRYKNQIHQPFESNHIDSVLADIAHLNRNSYSGCWDVVAFKDGHLSFVESKRAKKDKIRPSQTGWLASSLQYGLTIHNFLVVQWDF